MPEYKEYLGDGVYADFDGYNLRLTTEDGEKISNIIYLEPDVYSSLEDYVKRLKDKLSTKNV